MKRPISLTVNGRSIESAVEPRTHLADFVRDGLRLTGTHLGCEHGVCGACTVLIDGAPMRSCIAYAIACDGADVRTIEGFDGDPLMQALRHAFTRHHALQCGYCTPGVLITAHDIIQRLPDADESRVREELAGNLCRCTGYVGIVEAVLSVLTAMSTGGEGMIGAVSRPSAVPHGTDLRVARQGLNSSASTPVFRSDDESLEPTIPPHASPPPTDRQFAPSRTPARPQEAQNDCKVDAANALSGTRSSSRLSTRHGYDMSTPTGSEHEITLDAAPETLWPVLKDVATVVRCLPGASLAGPPTANPVRLDMTVAIGPMRARFEGAANVTFDDRQRTATIDGSGHDARSRSTSHGRIELSLRPSEPAGSIVPLRLHYTLRGPLAQFSRGAVVDAVVEQILERFAANLASAATGKNTEPQSPLGALGLVANAFRRWLRRWTRNVES